MILQSTLLDNPTLRVTKTYYQDGLIMPAHSHEFTSISIVLKGRLSEKVGDKTVVGSSIQTVIKPAGVVHENYFSKDSYVISVVIKDEEVFGGNGYAVLEEWDWFSGRESIGYFSSILKTDETKRQLEAFDHWMHYLSDACHNSTNLQVPDWLVAVKEYMDQHFTQEVRSDFLAKKFGVHRVYLARMFRKYFSLSIKEYLNALRVHNATGAVVMKEESLTRIAFDNGFSDQSHFNRKFKEATDFTPSELRALTRS